MSDDDPINDTDHFTAKKRLADGLRNIITGQTIALYVLALGVLFFCIATVFRWEELATLSLFLIASWLVVSGILATVGCLRLSNARAVLPVSVRIYVFNFPTLPSLLLLLIPFVWDIILVSVFAVLFPLYCIVPQYFIARWLAKETEDGTMQMVEDTTTDELPDGLD